MNPARLRKLTLEEAKPHIAAAIAAAAALGSAAIASNSQQQAASKAAGAAAVPKGSDNQGVPPTIASGLMNKQGESAADKLSTSFSGDGSSMAPPGKEGWSNIDVPTINDALGKTDLTSGNGQPAPVPGSAAASAGGGSSSSLLSNPQTLSALAGLASNALRPTPNPGGGLPQPGQTAGYNPTASAAMQRLQALMAQQRGGSGYGGF